MRNIESYARHLFSDEPKSLQDHALLLLLGGVEKVYAFLLNMWVSFYDIGHLHRHRLDAYTLSIGNITAGGTGKTPLVRYMAQYLLAQGERVAIISRGEVHYRRLTLPEGLTTARMLELIRAEPNLAGEITIAAEEGELLPETYSYVKGDSRDSIVRRARLAMEKTLEEAWRQNRRKVLKNRRQLLTLASIIEKETGVPEERADVAAVFINRLETGMKLQTDPTVIYALTKGKKDPGRPLYRKDLSVESPYNTYKYYGLPPGPICNPGREAIFAAVHPSDADYLYFVASGTGGHRFARSLKEHNRNVSLYKKAMKKK